VEESKSDSERFILIAEDYNKVDRTFISMLKLEQRRLED